MGGIKQIWVIFLLSLMIGCVLVLPHKVGYWHDSRFYVHASQTIGDGMRYLDHDVDVWMDILPPGDTYVAWPPLYPILLAAGQGFLSVDATVQLINILAIAGILAGIWIHLSGSKWQPSQL
jgi:hypothetical protein